jgi:hypothetical protein
MALKGKSALSDQPKKGLIKATISKVSAEKEYDGLLKEYESLRTEIMKRQEARLYILAFTMAVVGTILGISFQGSSPFALNSYLPIVLGIFALIVIISALSLTIQHTQQNKIIAKYIRKYIEPKIPTMGYETRWRKYCELKRTKSLIFPMTTSRALANTYILLTSAVFLVVIYPALSLGGYNTVFAFVIIGVFAGFALGLSGDLFWKKTKGWDVDWNILGEEAEKS